MSTCPECAQLLPPEARHCPACGHDLHVRRVAEPVLEPDPEAATDELLAAVITGQGMAHPPPPWVPPLEQRLAPATTSTATKGGGGDEDEDEAPVRDVLPDELPRRRLFRRR